MARYDLSLSASYALLRLRARCCDSSVRDFTGCLADQRQWLSRHAALLTTGARDAALALLDLWARVRMSYGR